MRDVKLRYKQTALGVVWVILQPLLGAVIFAFVFGVVAKMRSDGIPYLLFSYARMLGWQAFNGTLTKASACVMQNSQLVSKVFFLRLILPLSSVLSTFIDFAVGVVLMVPSPARGSSPRNARSSSTPAAWWPSPRRRPTNLRPSILRWRTAFVSSTSARSSA